MYFSSKTTAVGQTQTQGQDAHSSDDDNNNLEVEYGQIR